MIHRVTIANFKSIRHVSVDLAPVTILIGKSGVGKSNFLHAIRFLRNLLIDPHAAISVEGGWPQIWPFGVAASFRAVVSFSVPDVAEELEYELVLEPGQPNAHPQVRAERLSADGNPIIYKHSEKWIAWPPSATPPQWNSLVSLRQFAASRLAVLAYTALTLGIGCYEFSPDVFIGNSSRQRPFNGNFKFEGLEDTGENYLDVFRRLSQDLSHQRPKRQVLSRSRQINPTVDTMEVDPVFGPTRLVVGHKWDSQLTTVDLSQESSGFRRYVAHLLAIYQQPSRQLLMFEEPENGTYPGALSNLAEEFQEAPSAGRGQILLTTHSPQFLDGFTADEIRVVELDESGGTRIGPLDADQASAVKDRLMQPGELLTVDEARLHPAES